MPSSRIRFPKFLIIAASEGGRALAVLFSHAFVGRALGPQRYGVIGFAQGLYIYFALLASFGFDWIGARYAAVKTEPNDRMIDAVVVLRALSSVVAFLALTGTVLLLRQPVATKHAAICFGLTLLAVPLTVDWFFYGRQRLGIYFWGRVLGQLAIVIGVVALVRPYHTTSMYPLVFAAGTTLSGVVFAAAFVRERGVPKISIDRGTIRRVATGGMAVFLSAVFTQVLLNGSIVVLEFAVSDESVGFYSAAQRLAFGILFQSTTLLGLVFFPALSAAGVRGRAATLRIFARFITVALIGAAAAIGLAFAGRPVVIAIYSATYAPAGPLFSVLLVSVALLLVDSALSYSLLALEQERLVMMKWLVVALTTVVMNVVLVRSNGALGAAWANLVAAAVGLGTCTLLFIKTVRRM